MKTKKEMESSMKDDDHMIPHHQGPFSPTVFLRRYRTSRNPRLPNISYPQHFTNSLIGTKLLVFNINSRDCKPDLNRLIPTIPRLATPSAGLEQIAHHVSIHAPPENCLGHVSPTYEHAASCAAGPSTECADCEV